MKSKRAEAKIGDVFEVPLGGKMKKFFQVIAYDSRQLNSDVIRVFKKEHPDDDSIDLNEIVKGRVEFYAHCITKWGIKLGYWEKIGKSDDIPDLGHILFRDTTDYGRKAGEEPIRVSDNWYVWNIGDDHFTDVGKLVGENRNAEIGLVINPESIVHRMRTGEYDFPYYPSFE